MNQYNINSTEPYVWIYELYYYTTKTHLSHSKVIFYRGTVNNITSTTERNCAHRFKEHQRESKDENNTTAKYCFIRDKIYSKDLEFHIDIVHEYKNVDEWNEHDSEHWWVLDGIRRGYPLQNMKHGDLQDPNFFDEVDRVGIKTESEFIRIRKERKAAGEIGVNKYNRQVDAYHRLNTANMKLRADHEDEEHRYTARVDNLQEQVDVLYTKKKNIEDGIVSLTEQREKMLTNIKQDAADEFELEFAERKKKLKDINVGIEDSIKVGERRRSVMDKIAKDERSKEMKTVADNIADEKEYLGVIEARVKKAVGFMKAYNREAAVVHYSEDLNELANTFALLDDSKQEDVKALKAIENYMDFLDTFDYNGYEDDTKGYAIWISLIKIKREKAWKIVNELMDGGK